MFHKSNLQIKSIGLLVSSNVVAAVMIAAGTVLVSRIVVPSAFGQYSYAAQIAVAIYPALTLRFEQAIPLFGKRTLARSYLILGTLALAVLMSLALLLIGLVGLPIFAGMLELSSDLQEMFPLVILTAFSLAIAGVYQSVSLTQGSMSRLAVARVFRAVTMIVLQVLIVLVVYAGATSLLAADIGANIVQVLLLSGGLGMAGVWGLFRRPLRQTIKRIWLLARRNRDFPFVMLPHLLAHSALGLLLTTTLGSLYGTAALGQYYLMRKLIFGVLAIFSTAVYQQAIGDAAQIKREQIYSVARRALILLMLVTTVSALVILVAGPQLFVFAAGKEWAMAGRMAMATTPLILAEPITSTFAFVPVFLGLQRVAFGVAVVQGAVGLAAIMLAGWLGLSILPALIAMSTSVFSVMVVYVWWLMRRAKQVAEGQRA